MSAPDAWLDEAAVCSRLVRTQANLWQLIYRGQVPRPTLTRDGLRWKLAQVELSAEVLGVHATDEADA